MFIHIKSDESIPMAKKVLLSGGVIVYPTETVYGVGCIPTNEKAVNRITLMKARGDKPLPILCSETEMAFKLIKWNPVIDKLAEFFWPGPLTIVGKLKEGVVLPYKVTCGTGKLAVRVPAFDWTLKLLREVNGFLVGTSANRSGYGAPITLSQTLTRLGRDADLYVDGNETIYGKESTIVDVSDGKMVILREGAIPVRDLRV